MRLSFEEIIKNFQNLKVLIIGDPMLDIYFSGIAPEIAKEAPVPVVKTSEITYSPGGAGNSAVNASMLGAEVSLLGSIGHDPEGRSLVKLLSNFGVNTDFLIQSKKRQTITKQRVVADSQILIRVDTGSTESLSSTDEKEVIENLKAFYQQFDVVIITDHGYGVLTSKVIEVLNSLQSQYQKIVFVDAKHLDKYSDVEVTAIKPSYSEALSFLKLKPSSKKNRVKQILNLSQEISSKINGKVAIVSLDRDGVVVLEKNQKPIHFSVKPADNGLCPGAGDTFVSTFSLSLASGSSTVQATKFALAASSVVVAKEGTAFCSSLELREQLLKGFYPQENINYMFGVRKQ